MTSTLDLAQYLEHRGHADELAQRLTASPADAMGDAREFIHRVEQQVQTLTAELGRLGLSGVQDDLAVVVYAMSGVDQVGALVDELEPPQVRVRDEGLRAAMVGERLSDHLMQT